MSTHLMIDLETMGNNHKAAIVAIGAVLFDEEQILDRIGIRVDLQSSLDAGLVVDASTVYWWLGQSEAARQEILAKFNVFSLPEALGALTGQVGVSSGSETWRHGEWHWQSRWEKVDGIWSLGVAQDIVWLESAYRACGLPVPWSYGQPRCFRTKRAEPWAAAVRPADVGTAHNAADDAEYQARWLQNIWRVEREKGLR